jgi:prophage antirepressor-like protein
VKGFSGPRTIFVCEAGVFRLIFSSRKPEAERFKRWLAHEVLPSIRRTGRYESAQGAAARSNALALNAACRAIGEIRRSVGVRAAADELPEIFAKAGVTIKQHEQEQREFRFETDTDDKVVEILPGVRVSDPSDDGA